MIFDFDKFVDQRPYPNLARYHARPLTPEWRKFYQHWPFSEPPRIVEYFAEEGVTCNSWQFKYYLIAVSFFDFSIQWFELIPQEKLERMRRGQLGIMFFYNEGDNPERIYQHLCEQCQRNNIPTKMLFLISGNSAADSLPNCHWFPDHELLFRKRNKKINALEYHDMPRTRLFTALVRTHKWWRATTMAQLWRNGWHRYGYFSYNPDIHVNESELDNPIEIDNFENLRQDTYDFLQQGRFVSDSFTSDQHNDHHLCVPEHFTDSYLNVVIETHMDADQSNGVFLSEKTWKPIKHAQPFVIFGTAHSLAKLRDLGYRTFDGIIDNSYDNISNTTERWFKITQILQDMFEKKHSYMHSVLTACKQDLLWNQQHFLNSKKDRLNILLEKIKCK